MNITREVITDLLPLYLAGDASEDTNVLIKKFLENDPEFAKLVERSNKYSNQEELIDSDLLPPDFELELLSKTKNLINLRSWILGIAIFFTASLFGVRNVGNGIEWLWAGLFPGFVVCLLIAICSWIAYIVVFNRLNNVGL